MKMSHQCICYDGKDQHPDRFNDDPVNCGNCHTFNGVRCKEQEIVVEKHKVVDEKVGFCRW